MFETLKHLLTFILTSLKNKNAYKSIGDHMTTFFQKGDFTTIIMYWPNSNVEFGQKLVLVDGQKHVQKCILVTKTSSLES